MSSILLLLLQLLQLLLLLPTQSNGFQITSPAAVRVNTRTRTRTSPTILHQPSSSSSTMTTMTTQKQSQYHSRGAQQQSLTSLSRRTPTAKYHHHTSTTLYQSASASADASSPQKKKKKTSGIAGATFNLIKACVGSGVLALPAGLAVASDVPQAIIPACIFLVAIGAVSAYTFHALGRISSDSQETNNASSSSSSSLGDMWKQLVGESSAWIVDLSTAVMTLGVCVTYSMLLGDFTSDLLQQIVGRNTCIVALTIGCLYPLAQLKSLTALAPMSVLGVGGIVVTCIVMAIQLLCRGGGAGSTPAAFRVVGHSSNPLSGLVLASMAATAYLCHFSAPDFLQMVEGNMKQYTKLTVLGFSSVAVVNVAILSMGFLTFGGNCAGVILNNYASNDGLASLCRLLMIISVVGGHPFMLAGAKSALYSLYASYKKKTTTSNKKSTTASAVDDETTTIESDSDDDDDDDDSITTADDDDNDSITNDNDDTFVVSPRTNHLVTIALLLATTLPSLVLRNAGFVVSFNGATMGSAITYIFPAILMLKRNQSSKSSKWRHYVLNGGVLAWGIIAAVAGGTVSVLSAFAPHTMR